MLCIHFYIKISQLLGHQILVLFLLLPILPSVSLTGASPFPPSQMRASGGWVQYPHLFTHHLPCALIHFQGIRDHLCETDSHVYLYPKGFLWALTVSNCLLAVSACLTWSHPTLVLLVSYLKPGSGTALIQSPPPPILQSNSLTCSVNSFSKILPTSSYLHFTAPTLVPVAIGSLLGLSSSCCLEGVH